jgi:hypothetical protein
MKFVVGDLPEVVEDEVGGEPIPTPVPLPVTVNGRLVPREDVDLWAVDAKQGQTVTAEVNAARLGSPLDAKLEVLDPRGRVIAENDDARGADPRVRFTAGAEGRYLVRVADTAAKGGQAFVYRLTLTSDVVVDRVYPLGGRRGAPMKLHLFGQGVPAEPVEVALPADARADHAQWFTVGGKHTNPVLLDVDDLAEALEAEPNDDPTQVKPSAAPLMMNGRIDKPGDADCWAFAAKKGDVIDAELRAARLGSPLHGVLVLSDAAGKELARSDGGGPSGDPQLRFTVPADSTFVVRVSDQFRWRGGPEFAYRLRLAPPGAPDYRLTLAADVLSLPRGGQGKLRVQADRLGGFNEPITINVEGLPAGVTVSPATVAAGQNAVEIAFKAENSAVIASSLLTVRGSTKAGQKTATLALSRGGVVLDRVRLAVALPTPFKIVGDFQMQWASRGTTLRRRYRIERNGFDGPLEVSLSDKQARHLQGVTGPTITVPAGAKEFDYEVMLPPWMEVGRTCRVCVMGVGVVEEKGVKHEVSFSSVNQNEQLVAVIEPARLAVEVGRASLVAVEGKSVTVPIRVARTKGIAGPVKVELIVPPHVKGVMAEPVEVAADMDRFNLTVRFAAGPLGPFNMPLTLRATASDGGRPVVGEAILEVGRGP